ncbi:MAG: hypothetical protein KA010_00075 [Saprospiraceae bacterium]|nr:hypothetical protein [Saprospiraceae bacterium]
MKPIFSTIIFLLILSNALFAQNQKSYKASYTQATKLGSIPALPQLTPSQQQDVDENVKNSDGTQKLRKTKEIKQLRVRNQSINPNALPNGKDPLLQSAVHYKNENQKLQKGHNLSEDIKIKVNIDGLSNAEVMPPDPSGDVGTAHYMQAVNGIDGSHFRIYNKNGQSVYGPAQTQSIWSQLGIGSSLGDPIIRFDRAAKRWILIEMKGGNELLMAISNTENPTQGWAAYSFQTLGFPDYPKLFIWNNAYILGLNEITEGNFCSAYALDRQAMLSGSNNVGIYRFEMPKHEGISFQPPSGADWESELPPPPSSPSYIIRMYDDSWSFNDEDHLEIWKTNIDWNDQENTYIEGPTNISTAPFESTVCEGWNICINQPNTSDKISALDQIIMYRAPYRNFGNYESIVLNHVVDIDGNDTAGLRWYELRKNTDAQDWSIYQQGTIGLDDNSRFMGAIDIDANGNIALGYSVSSSTIYPSLRIIGRRNSDPLGTMTLDETLLKSGEAASSTERWGDYSAMNVDPVDGKTFWFTGEYMPINALWGTRIGAFELRRDTNDIAPVEIISPKTSAYLSQNETVSIKLKNFGYASAQNFEVSYALNGQAPVNTTLNGILASDSSTVLTFTPTIDLNEIGTSYELKVYTSYELDNYKFNDTLIATIQKLAKNDAGIQLAGLPQKNICNALESYTLKLTNYGTDTLRNAKINYRINGNEWITEDWVGNLSKGKDTTIALTIYNIPQGNNNIQIEIGSPNNTTDDIIANNSLNIAAVGIPSDWELIIKTPQGSGTLNWELMQGNTSLFTDNVSNNFSEYQYNTCVPDSSCFTLRLSSPSNSVGWSGVVQVIDFENNIIFETDNIAVEPGINRDYNLCAPNRNNFDIGIVEISSPNSGIGLSENEPVKVKVKNYGINPISDFNIYYALNGSSPTAKNIAATLLPGESKEFAFDQTVDLSANSDNYNLLTYTQLNGNSDEKLTNDSLTKTIANEVLYDVKITDITKFDGCDEGNQLPAVVLNLENNGILDINFCEFAYVVEGSTDTFAIALPVTLPANETKVVLLPLNAYLSNSDVVVNIWVKSLNIGRKDNIFDNSFRAITFHSIDEYSPITVEIQLDNEPEHLFWQLKSNDGQVIFQDGPYQDFNQTIKRSICLPKDVCYTFEAWKDNGNSFEGEINVNSPFDFYIYKKKFNANDTLSSNSCCMYAPCALFDVGIETIKSSTSTSSDGKMIVHAFGGTPPYKYKLTGVTPLQQDSVFNNLPAGAYSVYVRDGDYCVKSKSTSLEYVTATHEIANDASQYKMITSPNPTRGIVNIEVKGPKLPQSVEAEVYDNNGKLLFIEKLVKWDNSLKGIFTLENFPSALYWIKIPINNEVILTQKLLKM